MNILVLNGSPKQHGTVAALLRGVVDGVSSGAGVEWVDVYSLEKSPQIGQETPGNDQTECECSVLTAKAERSHS